MTAGQFAQYKFEFTEYIMLQIVQQCQVHLQLLINQQHLEVNDTNITTATFHGATSQE